MLVDELLQPAAVGRDEAVRRCRDWLRRRRGLRSLGLLLLPRSPLPELVALATWWEAAAAIEEQRDARAGLDALTRELDLVLADEPTSPLGVALWAAVRRHRLPPLLLHGQLQARRRDLDVRSYETREALQAHVRQLAHPYGRILLRVLGHASERNDVLADALSTALQLTAWLSDVRADWEREHLYLPVEDLTRFGVDLGQLAEGRVDDAFRRLMVHGIDLARGWFAKGWPLTEELGPWRGRQLAFLLRWHAADLNAIEAARMDVLKRRPRSGILRLLACLTVSAATPRP